MSSKSAEKKDEMTARPPKAIVASQTTREAVSTRRTTNKICDQRTKLETLGIRFGQFSDASLNDFCVDSRHFLYSSQISR